MSSSRVGGFTLIELLIVMAIVMILAGLVLGTSGYMQRRAARERAETEMVALATALENYKADYGAYPEGTNVSGGSFPQENDFLVEALQPEEGEVYFEFSKSMLSGSNVVDPFRENYGYQYPGDPTRSGTNFFDLFSRAGAGTNTNGWIKNW